MESFLLPVTFNNKTVEYSAQLLQYAYSYKLEIDIDGTKLQFEPDEERNWRALISFEDMQANKKLNPDLIKAIAQAIETITKWVQDRNRQIQSMPFEVP